MGKVKSRILAMLMAMILCLGLLPTPALAYDQDIVTDGTVTIDGDDNTQTGEDEDEGGSGQEEITVPESYQVTLRTGQESVLTYQPITVKEGETVDLPTPKMNEGYTFLYWYDVETGEEWASDMPVTRDMTLAIHYSKQVETLDISFICTEGFFVGDEGPYKADLISTNDSSIVVTPPEAPIRDGYRFVGWATEDGTMWTDFSVPITEDLTLYAVWESLDDCVIHFDWNGLNISPAPSITVPYGSTRLSGVTSVGAYEGHTQVGWADRDGKVWITLDPVNQTYSAIPITQDLTLYPVWDPPFEDIGDTFRFSNTSAYFQEDYQISEPYLRILSGGSAAIYGALYNQTLKEWGGSCYGMAAVYGLSHLEELSASTFVPGAQGLRDLPYPVDSEAVNDLINFYYLSQVVYPIGNYRNDYDPTNESVNLRSLVSRLNQSDYLVVGLRLDDGSDNPPGHAVVATGYTRDSSGDYLVNIWDPNQPMIFHQLRIESDFSGKAFDYTVSRGKTPFVKYSLSADLYNTFNLEDHWGQTASGQSTEVSMGLLGIDAGSFRVETSGGRYAVIENGVRTTGTLPVTDITPDGAGSSDGRIFTVGTEDGEILTVLPLNGGASDFSLLEGDTYTRVTVSGAESVAFTETGVTTSCPTATRQTISITSDNLGGDWNTLTISGTDTGFQVSTEKERVTVVSDNSVSATVTGSNAFTRKTSASQTVSVTPAGVTVSTASGSLTTEETTEEPASSNPFTDVSADAYYHDAVLWAVENGITSGTSATTFSPNAVCTRAQAVTFLWRAAGSPEPGIAENPFTDVASDSYYYKAVLWAVEKGITSGTSATTFSPNVTCSRAQIVTFLWREQQSPSVSTSGAFTDVNADAYYAKAVDWAVSEGITSGTSATTFSPNANCTRAQIVTFLWRAYQG